MHEEPGFFAEPRNWVFIAFVLFFVIFGRKLWAALAEMLDDRGAKVRTELEEAARLRQEAEAMLRDAEARRADALREAQALIDGAKAEAGRVAAAAAAEAEASAKRREQMALDRIAAAEKAAVDEVRMTAVEVATVAARQVIAEGLTADADCAADRSRNHPVAERTGQPKGCLSQAPRADATWTQVISRHSPPWPAPRLVGWRRSARRGSPSGRSFGIPSGRPNEPSSRRCTTISLPKRRGCSVTR